MKYVVFGYYVDNHQRFTATVDADNHKDAEEAAFYTSDAPADLLIVGSLAEDGTVDSFEIATEWNEVRPPDPLTDEEVESIRGDEQHDEEHDRRLASEQARREANRP